jgi:hypothetical protein
MISWMKLGGTVPILGAALICFGCSSSIQGERSNQVVKVEWSSRLVHLTTFEGFYVRDLLWADHDSIQFWLTPEEQARVIQVADSVGFWGLPSLIEKDEHVTVYHSYSPYLIRVKSGDRDHSIKIKTPAIDSASAYRALRVYHVIDSILCQRPAYKNLPNRNRKLL